MRIILNLLLICYYIIFSVKNVNSQEQINHNMPIISVKNLKDIKVLRMNELDITVEVTGNIARTTMSMNFENKTNRILDGELNFPLGEGQSISRFAMDVNGKLREAVPIEKQKGQEVFESIVRQNIDPGLLEKTAGNNFKTRVYPIPANGNKRVLIAYDQELLSSKKGSLYLLPLQFKEKLDKFNLKVEVFKQNIKPQLEQNELVNFDFEKYKEIYIAKKEMTNYIANKQIGFIIPKAENIFQTYVEKNELYKNKDYFYINLAVEKHVKEKKNPKIICLLYDVSNSLVKKDTTKELKILDEYFKKLKNVKVQLVTFSHDIHRNQIFEIKNGDWNKLKKDLENPNYDGGTQLGILDLNEYKCDEFILISDGISNFGKSEINIGKKPVTVISSIQSANFSYLKFISMKSGGQFINLKNKTVKQAIEILFTQNYQFISAEFDKKAMTEIYPNIPTTFDKNFSITGQILKNNSKIKLNFGIGNKVMETVEVKINKKNLITESHLIKHIWASKKIDFLDLMYERNKEEIIRIGKKYNLVTRNTSLIILDRLEDYIQHKIVPPKELRKKYFEIIEKQKSEKKEFESQNIEKLFNFYNEKIDWWNTWENKKVIEKKTEALIQNESEYLIMPTVDGSVPPPPPAPPAMLEELIIVEDEIEIENDVNIEEEKIVVLEAFEVVEYKVPIIEKDNTSSGETFTAQEINRVSINETDAVVSTSAGVYSEDGEVGAIIGGRSDANIMIVDGQIEGSSSSIHDTNEVYNNKTAMINLQAWNPNTPYMTEIKEADKKNRYSVYLNLKKQYETTPSFFLDVANYFATEKEEQIALRVLSNIAELNLENHELLRVLAHRLEQLKYYKLAIFIYEKLLEIRAEEPQSYRDLALCLASNKQYQRSVDILYDAVQKTWDGRFPLIEKIMLYEMNTIIVKAGKDINTNKIDKRLLKHLPVDVRIVLNWDTDNSDMDLWVTDPRGEKCFYGYKNTSTGGRISNDFTGGYGPEEFIIRNAIKGKYIIHVNYYGSSAQRIAVPTTIYLELYTNYGKKNEKKKVITLQLSTKEKVINVGELIFD